MATEQNFTIRKGRTCTITVDVIGVANWTDKVCKLFASREMEQSVVDIELVGTIDPAQNKVTFSFEHTTTNEFDAPNTFYYETSLYEDGSTLTYIKDTNYGLINLDPVVKVNPSI